MDPHPACGHTLPEGEGIPSHPDPLLQRGAGGGPSPGLRPPSPRRIENGTRSSFETERLSFHAEPPLLEEESGEDKNIFQGPVVIPGEVRLEGFTSGLPCEVYYWPGPRSYTGGPVAEIHTLGSPPLLEALVRTLCRAGARLAEPGEFTLRAFLSGRIDLTEAEAVLGVVDAVDADELAVALEQLSGGLARPLGELRNQLLDLLVYLEAGLDFPDEDLPFLTRTDLVQRLREAQEKVQTLADQLQSRRIASEGVTVVLVGRPNAGKSSLFNALLSREHAIVSPSPGTTRDYLIGQLDLGGIRCRLVDTAGLNWPGAEPQEERTARTDLPKSPTSEDVRENSLAGSWRPGEIPSGDGVSSIEAAARQMTIDQLRQADVQVWCVDASEPIDPEDWTRLAVAGEVPRVVVLTKGDLPPRVDSEALAAHFGVRPILTSSLTGQGLEQLRTQLLEEIRGLLRSGNHAVWATALRSAESIRLAAQALVHGLELAERGGGEELIAAEVRTALDELDKVSGAVYTEDILEQIFSRFCIGK